MDLDVAGLIVVAAVFAAAGAVKGVIGLGLPTVAMGLLGAAMPPAQAAAVLVIPALLTNVWQMARGRWLGILLHRMWPMLVCAVVGTLLTAGVLTQADSRLTTGLLGAVLVFYAMIGLVGIRMKVPPTAEPALGPLVGTATGLINGATGIFVVPGVPYLQSLDLGKDELVQALALSAFVSSMALALGLGINSGLDASIGLPAAIALATAFAGMAVGQAVRDRLSVAMFQRAVLIGLAALGVSMVARAL